MTIAELIDALTALPNKDRDVSVHVLGRLSGIVDITAIDSKDGYGEESETTIYLKAKAEAA